jgi:hypothetical protein
MNPQNQKYSDIIARLTKEPLTQWEEDFCKSIADHIARSYRDLSVNQVRTLTKINIKYSPEHAALEAAWKEEYKSNPALKEKFDIIMPYVGRSGYYNQAYAEWLQNPAFIPDRTLFKKITSNPYNDRFYNHYTAPNKYKIGDLLLFIGGGLEKTYYTCVVESVDKYNHSGRTKYDIFIFNTGIKTDTDDRYLRVPNKRYNKRNVK